MVDFPHRTVSLPGPVPQSRSFKLGVAIYIYTIEHCLGRKPSIISSANIAKVLLEGYIEIPTRRPSKLQITGHT